MSGTMETSFFRDREMFEALREIVLPRMIALNADARRLRIWCAGCSTGQEAYSMSLLLREHFAGALAGWDVKVVATDLAEDAVDYARRGRYRRPEVNRGLTAKMLVKCFLREDEDWEIAPELRAICEFRQADVCEPMTGAEEFDLVLMRNVLLFLPSHERARAFENVRHRMDPSGVLVLGQAEQAEDLTNLFEADYLRGHNFYRLAKQG